MLTLIPEACWLGRNCLKKYNIFGSIPGYMRLSIAIVAVILLFSLQSCDPALSFSIINKSAYPASVQIIHTPQPQYFYQYKVEGDTLNIPLAPGGVFERFYGIGVWSAYAMNDFVQCIQRVEIHSHTETRIYSDSFQIHHLFEKNLKGSFKARIEITIE
jgi:hypothetical protein